MKKVLLLVFLCAFSMLAWAQKSSVITENSVGATVLFSTGGTYEWEWNSSISRLQSTNYHESSSTSSSTISITTTSQCSFSFDYSVSSESGYDMLTITLDGSTIVDAISGTQSNSYSSTLSAGSHSMKLSYIKDGSVDNGDDRSYLSNMRLVKQIPSNEIWYTSTDGNIVTPYRNSFGANIVSNTYENGQGKIVFDRDVTSIGDNAFEGCTGLTSINIPNSVTSIGDYAFFDCTGLTSINIPNSVTSIGDHAFSYCSSLISISIPDGVTNISAGTFSFCNSLSSISVSSGNPVYDSRYDCNAIIETNSNRLIAGCKNTIIPSDITSIGYSAFHGHKDVVNINIPSRVTSIGSYAFAFCGFDEISIPSNVVHIGEGAFASEKNINAKVSVSKGNPIYDSRDNCNAIIETATNKMIYANNKTIIPEGVVELSYCFMFCKNIPEIVIPSSVTLVNSHSFYSCSNINRIVCKSDFPPEILGTFTFFRWDFSNSVLVVPYGTKPLYEAADRRWKDFGAIVEMEPTFIEIADGTAYTQGEDVTNNIRYTRIFNNTNWQALYIPFSISVETLAENGLKVAELNDTHQWDFDGDGIADSTHIEFFTLSSGSTLANHPYLIKADAAFDLTLELSDVELKSAEENSIDCSSTKQLFTFCGTYAGVSGADMYNNNYYAMAGGCLKRVSNSDVSLKPQRWYLKIENRNGSPVKYFAPSIRFSIDGIDGEPDATGLSSVICREEDNVIYGLDGVRQDASRLTKGLYIQNGQKVIVR